VRETEGDSVHVGKLISFLFGITSHDFADISWHWGINVANAPDSQGFLRAMSHNQSYCKDSWNTPIGKDPSCHSIGDIGADMVTAKRGGIHFMPYTWEIPIEDMVSLYKINGIDTS